MKEYPHLLAITYIGFAKGVIEPNMPLIGSIRRLGTAVVARCGNFGAEIPEGMMREGDLCCANLNDHGQRLGLSATDLV
jgi:hypothetical protein